MGREMEVYGHLVIKTFYCISLQKLFFGHNFMRCRWGCLFGWDAEKKILFVSCSENNPSSYFNLPERALFRIMHGVCQGGSSLSLCKLKISIFICMKHTASSSELRDASSNNNAFFRWMDARASFSSLCLTGLMIYAWQLEWDSTECRRDLSSLSSYLVPVTAPQILNHKLVFA